MKPEIIIYDFDGVIANSVNIKTEAFVELYKNYDLDIQNAIKNYHLCNGGVSRYEKFKYFHEKILKEPINGDKINDLANKFSILVKDKIISCNYINGIEQCLKDNYKNSKQFVCTGTPEIEIIEIIEKKMLQKYFYGIYGSPSSKIDIINHILSDNHCDPKKCLFFGDAITDYNAAKSTNINFIGIENVDTIFPSGTILIKDFNDILLKNIFKNNEST